MGIALLAASLAALAGCASVVTPAAHTAVEALPTLPDGVRHRQIIDPEGPWSIEVVEVDPRACGVTLRSVKARDRLVGRLPTTGLARQAEERWGRPAVAAVNADFFSFDPDGVPVEIQVSAGEPVRGPGGRSAFGVVDDTLPFIASLALDAAAEAAGRTIVVGAINTPADTLAVLLNRFASPALLDVQHGVMVRWLELPPHIGVTTAAIVTDTVIRFERLGGNAGAIRLPPGERLEIGDTLHMRIDLREAPGRVTEAVGGTPRLLRDGAEVYQQADLPEAFAAGRHPRTAVGWRGDGTILLVTVDGRQPGRSEGMSLAELAALVRKLGATDALNLDGGGSTTMVLLGSVANQPSDATGERAVANALVVLGPRPAECEPGSGPR